jgi:hypothetical protein
MLNYSDMTVTFNWLIFEVKLLKFAKIVTNLLLLLAHLSQSDMVSFCDRFSSGIRPSGVPPFIRKLLL